MMMHLCVVLRIFTGRGQLHVTVTVLQALVLFGHSQEFEHTHHSSAVAPVRP